MKKITLVIPCYNEEENIDLIHSKIGEQINSISNYVFDITFIDNCSTDSSRRLIRALCEKNPNTKAIFNARNFGPQKSPFYGLLQNSSDAVILISADLQDPPEMIPDMIREWEKGANTIIAVKASSEENKFMYSLRKFYYWFIESIAEVPHINGFIGYGLYSKAVIDNLKKYHDSKPYLRGLISELSSNMVTLKFNQKVRLHGKSKAEWFTMLDIAINGVVNHSRVPLRFVTISGLFLAVISLLISLGYFVYKLVYWNEFKLGLAPLVIGLFFFSSVQLLFLGIIGEYLGGITDQVKKRPLVIEDERINF